jgi:hypothetical protein
MISNIFFWINSEFNGILSHGGYPLILRASTRGFCFAYLKGYSSVTLFQTTTFDYISAAMKEAIRKVVIEHKRSGRPLAVWENGRVKRVAAK